MKRVITWINLAGAVVLAILCIAQWQRDRKLNLEINRLQKEHYAQQQKISEQDKAANLLIRLRGFSAVLDQGPVAKFAIRSIEFSQGRRRFSRPKGDHVGFHFIIGEDGS